MDDLKNFCCQHKHCPKYGIRGEGNITVRAVSGKNNTRLLRCLHCKEKFSEHTGTIFYNSRLPKDKVVSIMEHVAEGHGMRKPGRLTKVCSRTVSRYPQLAGEHADQLHDELVEFSPQHRGGSTRRKVGLRFQAGKKLRRKQSG